MLDQMDVAGNFQNFSKFSMGILYPISGISVFLDISEISSNYDLWLSLTQFQQFFGIPISKI